MDNIHPKLRDLLEMVRVPTPIPDEVPSSTSNTGRAAQLYCERRRREEWFDAGLFWEPSWDLLLYLYDAYETGQTSVPVRSLAKAPFAISDQSTSRWLDLLIGKGYVVKSDELKAVALTTKAIAAIQGFLDSLERS